MSVEAIKANLRASVRTTFEETGPDVVADVQERVSVPVQRVPGGLIRSLPGEYPRKEYGDYQAAWSHRVEEEPDGAPVLFVENDSGIGRFLEYGTERMQPRPHARPTFVDWVRRLPQRVMIRLRSDFH